MVAQIIIAIVSKFNTCFRIISRSPFPFQNLQLSQKLYAIRKILYFPTPIRFYLFTNFSGQCRIDRFTPYLFRPMVFVKSEFRGRIFGARGQFFEIRLTRRMISKKIVRYVNRFLRNFDICSLSMSKC